MLQLLLIITKIHWLQCTLFTWQVEAGSAGEYTLDSLELSGAAVDSVNISFPDSTAAVTITDVKGHFCTKGKQAMFF